LSRIALSGNASGTGTFTIASPNSNSDRTLNLPDNSGTVLTSASTVAASQITGALNASGSAPIYACRAWVNFNGTGTVAINASGNVSSITDLGTGTYNVNFTTAMPDANYSAQQSTGDASLGRLAFGYQAVPTTTVYQVVTTTFAGSNFDPTFVAVAIFR
jgi:hypothetical protein